MSISVMYNACFGGFGLSAAAIAEYRRRCPNAEEDLPDYRIPRHDPVMVAIVREMGAAANDRFSQIHLRTLPAHYEKYYAIREYDGMESVAVRRHEYQVDAIKSILGDRTTSKADKLARISAVVNAEDAEDKFGHEFCGASGGGWDAADDDFIE